jgi:hypothetical protein
MRLPAWITSAWTPKAGGVAPPASLRDRIAVALAIVTIVCLGAAFFLSKGTQVLMPGPLASAHGAIEKCSACHTKSGDSKLTWAHGLVAGDPLADSKACLTCHKMPNTAFKAHGTTLEALEESTKRLTKVAAQTPQPQSARAQNIAFPTKDVLSRDLYCATCHQEHQGTNFKLSKISNEQCRSCHVVKFDSFDGNHPKFENYPFKQRTGIIYDHAGHFGKHFPEVAKKDPARRIPETCSTCHDSREDKRVMAVAPFDKTCTSCHLDQIVGKERASGPKGVAFLTVPGLDMQTLKKKNAAIGEWPEESEAALTPFMKMMIGRNERGRALIKTVDGLNLQDLSNANAEQIKAVTKLAWEVKGLFHALIKGKASDVLADLNIGSGAKLSPALVADLTASIPRDVVMSAQQQWLPSLATEMANRSVAGGQDKGDGNATIKETRLNGAPPPEKQSAAEAPPPAEKASPQGEADAGEATETANAKADAADEAPAAEKKSSASAGSNADDTDSEKQSASEGGQEASEPEAEPKETRRVGLDPPVCTVRIFGQCLVTAEPKTAPAPSANFDGSTEQRSANELPPPMRAGVGDAEKAGAPEPAARKTYTVNAGPEDGEEAPAGESAAPKRWTLPSGTARSIEAARTKGADSPARSEKATGESEPAKAKPDSGKSAAPAGDPEKAAAPQGSSAKSDAAEAKPDGAKETPVSASEPPPGNPGDQKDDLLFPTEEELRAMKSVSPEKAAKSDAPASSEAASKAEASAPASAPATSERAAAPARAKAVPVISIESDVDPESWAEYGGWYRQDFAIYYRPTGHKDKFIYSWLFLTGPQAPKGDKSPAGAVFDYLTGKDAQGSCTKCHSVDDIQGRGRVVNFSPPSAKSKQGRFTNFIHEPHMGVMENRGCLTCHSLEKGRPYLKSYEQGNPHEFTSNFGEVKKDLCQTCHTATMARQDCLTCHKYHVNGVITPTMSTKLPAQ